MSKVRVWSFFIFFFLLFFVYCVTCAKPAKGNLPSKPFREETA